MEIRKVMLPGARVGQISGNTAYIGITDYAQDALGDIVYVECPRRATHLKQETFSR